jgi:TRAP-type C4-dicarboxylate transport system substrate-binding protein
MKTSMKLGLGLAGLLAFSVSAMAQEKWNLPAAFPAGNFHTENLVQFAKDVEEATGGKLQITVHPNATLFKAPEIKRAVQTGQAEIGEVLMSLHENESPFFGIDNLPFLTASYEDSDKLWEAVKPEIEKKLASQKLTLLYAVPWPPQGLYANKELNTVDDLKGLKWRAYNATTSKIGEAVGAQPVTVQSAELAQALATGVVNSMMTSSATGADMKVWESLSHYYDVQGWQPRNIIFVNTAKFEALDKDVQEAVLKAAAEAQ